MYWFPSAYYICCNNINNSMDDQDNQQQFLWCSSYTRVVCIIVVIVIATYIIKKVRKIRKRVPNIDQVKIDSNKIILAIQPKDFLVRYSNKKQQGFIKLDITRSSSQGFFLKQKLFNHGDYFKPIFTSQKKLKKFIQDLHNNSKIQLILYTVLEPEVAEVLLQILKIAQFFPESRRKFCNNQGTDPKKHPIAVDKDTKRVIIMTPNRDDHEEYDHKYFLVVKPKPQKQNFLKDVQMSVKNLVQKNQNLSLLHQELTQFKVNLESDEQEIRLI